MTMGNLGSTPDAAVPCTNQIIFNYVDFSEKNWQECIPEVKKFDEVSSDGHQILLPEGGAVPVQRGFISGDGYGMGDLYNKV